MAVIQHHVKWRAGLEREASASQLKKAKFMQSKVFHRVTTALPTACLLILAACGGGGSSSTSTSTSTTPTTPSATPAVVTGVAAIGAPLVDASIKVVDATGTAVSLLDASGNTIANGVTNVADGSYKLILGTSSPNMPLFIEAVGTDATGLPVVLHSLVQANTAPLVANITPLTDAVVAEILGADPKTIFQNASSNASSIALLGNATMVAGASTQIKTIVGSNLTDAKVSSPSALNLFQDATFTTNKTLVDAALEGLRIQIVKDTTGNDQLQLSNRFVAIGTPEVAVSLATAKTQLSMTTGGSVAKAIVSTNKTTTSATATLVNLGVLDNLTIAVNNLIAQRAVASGFAPLLSLVPAPPSPALAAGATVSYAYNGRKAAALEQKLAGYAANNYQLSPMQVTGCVDDPIPTKGCVNLAVSSVVTDPTGKLVDVLSDAVTYSKSTTPNWTISGNGRYANIGVFSVAYAVFGLDGSLASSATANPGIGVQVSVSAQDSNGAQTAGNTQIQLPSGHSVPFAYCAASTLCVWPTPSVLPTATGDLADTLLQQPALGWIGSTDANAGAKYIVSYASWITVTNQSANTYLAAGLPTNLSTGLFPAIDGVSASKPLTGATIAAGFTLSWANWAAANPNMKLFSVRTVIASAAALPLITDNPISLGNATSITVTPTVLPVGFVPSAYEVWIGAVDNLGHRYFTQLTGSS
jgi:hypothetical protein